MSGLLVAGVEIAVDGVDIVNGKGTPWSRLDSRDYRMRRTPWIRQLFVHSTKGIWPQHVKPGRGPGGADELVAEFFRRDTKQSATQLVVDRDGSAACLADIAAACAFHATVSNDWAVGLEMYQLADGGIYEATLDSTVRVMRTLCEILLIPYQCSADSYLDGRRGPIARMLDGGRDCVGIFGHRDNTHDRGRGDPGDSVFERLVADGCEPLSYSTHEDLKVWRRRQERLVSWGEQLVVDGIAGQRTIAAMHRCGFASGRDLDAAVEAPLR